MHGLAPESLLTGKEEDARIQIAGRVGDSLSVDDLATADRRAAELLARALADDAIENVRVALSKAIARAKHLPRDLALKLAHDVDSVACLPISRGYRGLFGQRLATASADHLA